MNELQQYLSSSSRIYFISVGCAEGVWMNDPSFENQQYPEFLDKYEHYPKTIILIDECLQTPTYLEILIQVEKYQCFSKTQFQSLPGYISRFNDLDIIVLKSNNIITYAVENGAFKPSNTTLELFQMLTRHVIFTNSVLIAESFSGTSLDFIKTALESITPIDKILYSLYFGGDFGCNSRKCFLSNIEIDFSNGHPVLFNPQCLPKHEIYYKYMTESNPDKKKQIAWSVFQYVSKKLQSNAYFIDLLNRKNEQMETIDQSGWTQLKMSDFTKQQLYGLYLDPTTHPDAISIINTMFRQEYIECCSYLPQTHQFNFPFDIVSQKSYQMTTKLQNELSKIYEFNSLATLNSE